MKTFKGILIAAAISMSALSCNVEGEDILTIDNIEDQLTASPWTVKFYLNNNIDETTSFDGYVITFKGDGTLMGKKGFEEINGRWIEEKVTKEILIHFDAAAAPFSKLAETWRIRTKEDKLLFFENQTITEELKIQR